MPHFAGLDTSSINGYYSQVQWGRDELNGSIPSSIGDLKHLRFIEMFQKVTGQPSHIDLPETFGNLTMLKTLLMIGSGRATHSLKLPQSMSNLASLTSFQIYGFDLQGGLPPGMFSIAALEAVYVNGVPLQSLPAVTGTPNLEVFSLIENGLRAPAPSFKGLSKLQAVEFTGNFLSGGTHDMFDGCTALQTVDIAANRLSCSLLRYV
jgi:hypothetical protein